MLFIANVREEREGWQPALFAMHLIEKFQRFQDFLPEGERSLGAVLMHKRKRE